MASAKYAEVLASLYALEAAKGMDFKLERVELTLKSLGDPQRQFPAVHVAGTNGKGSVAAMLHAMLSASGYRVGLYTSPHLVSFTERIRIDDGAVSEDEVVQLVREIHAAATLRGIDLTFFEFTTVMAFLYFARREVDVAVVEVGLGGSLDATNVLAPVISVITTIGLDHEEFLGNTIEAVAREKGGIIKPDRPVVIGNVGGEAARVLNEIAKQRSAPPYWWGRDFSLAGPAPLRFQGMGWEVGAIRLGLRGAYQEENAATALAATALLRQKFRIDDDAVRYGLARVRWPGRLELMGANPVVVLDGAHNADGIAALMHELPAIVGDRKLHVLFGVMREKHWQPMIDAIGPIASSVTLTRPLPPRGEEPSILARSFEPYCSIRIVPDPLAAVRNLLQSTDPRDAVLVTGSLFLIGAVYPHFLRPSAQSSLFAAQPATHP
jgi:dihydrofolate synthase/folylpolyglutamate synthase